MSMLAEPRRKQKVINLRAKNNAWSNDSTKFGQRMLEKMGWSSGKGLGAKENGIVEHVVARYKNDEKGLGFEDKNDQWTKHEDDFDVLLANLSQGEENKEKLHSGVSLEDKSKKSKARIHYHKFTRGKDLSRYSEKDLANIFGKKSFKNGENPEPALKDEAETTEKKFTEKGSMEDYFKSKLAAFKSKKSCQNTQETENIDVECGFKGFSGTDIVEETAQEGVELQSFSFYDNTGISEQDYEQELKPKKNKKKKSKCKESENEGDLEKTNSKDDNISIQELDTQITKNKVKKSKKQNSEIPKPCEVVTETCELITETVSRKKSKARKQEAPEDITEANTDQDIEVPKKKKKRKNKDIEK